jgi:selenium metabolism protein YedF
MDKQPQTDPKASPAPGPTVLAISGEEMGRGDSVLGKMLMRTHLHVVAEAPRRPDVIVLFNGGVNLAAVGSAVVDDLSELVRRGCRVLLCGTCVNYYDLKEQVAVGEISNMHDITDLLMAAGKVISL